MQYKNILKLSIMFLLPSIIGQSKVMQQHEIWSKEYKVQDRYYSSNSQTNNVVAFSLSDGDVLLEVDYAKRHIKSFSGVVRSINETSFKVLKPSLDPKHGNPKVQNLLNLEEKQYDYSGKYDRILEFDVKNSRIALSAKQMHALNSSEKISVDLEQRKSSKGYAYFVLLLRVEGNSPIVLLPWKS